MGSTEPGYYEDGSYGIRIENVVIVRTAQTPNNFGDKGFLAFEHVTLVRQKQNGQPPDSNLPLFLSPRTRVPAAVQGTRR